MEKVCIVQDVDELDRENKMILVGYEVGRYVLGGRYGNGNSFPQRRSLVRFGGLLCRLVERRCEQDAEGIEELIVLGGALPEPAILETLKITVESIPGDRLWTVWMSLNITEQRDGVSEEGVVRRSVGVGSELIEDALHEAKQRSSQLRSLSFLATTAPVNGPLPDLDESGTVSDRDLSANGQRLCTPCQPRRRLHHRPRHYSSRIRAQCSRSESHETGSCESLSLRISRLLKAPPQVRTNAIPKSARRRDWLRPLWLLGMTLYILSQLIGSTLALDYMRAGMSFAPHNTLVVHAFSSRIRRPTWLHISHL